MWNVGERSGADIEFIATIERQRSRSVIVGRQSPREPLGRPLSGQCILARYNLAPLNPRLDLPTPARRRETPPIPDLRPILTSPRAYWPNARRALVFDSFHPPPPPSQARFAETGVVDAGTEFVPGVHSAGQAILSPLRTGDRADQASGFTRFTWPILRPGRASALP